MSRVAEPDDDFGPEVHKLEWRRKKVWVREMSGADRDRLQQLIKAHPDGLVAPGSDARLVAMFVCNEDGTRKYDLDNEEDIRKINRMALSFLRAVITKGNRISGLGEEAVEEAKTNFPATPSDDSTSASPATLAA